MSFLASITIPPLEKLPDYGDLMPLGEFVTACHQNFFIDYDGHGYWATATGYDPDERVNPSSLAAGHVKPPRTATHVLWFNR